MSRLVILVDFTWTRNKDPRIPLGHASLLAALENIPDLSVQSVVIPVNKSVKNAEKIVENILNYAAGWKPTDVDIAFGAYVWGEELLQKVLLSIRQKGFAGRIIIGGPQVSYQGSGLEKLYPLADVFIRGYAEDALRELVQSPLRNSIPGVHWTGTHDKCEQANVDLESLTSPWLNGVFPLKGQRFVRWETQRGCPFNCAFCQHQEAGAKLRQRSFCMDRIEAEIDLFCKSGVEDIAVLDPIFNMAPHATAVLQRFAANEYKGKLSLQCRAETISESFLDVASTLNTRLEFGLQTIHSNEGLAINRKNNIQKVDRVLSEVRHRGINHEISLIYGLPQQTLDSFKESIRWCLERHIPVIKAFPLLLLRGTKLECERDKWGLVDQGGAMPMVVESNSFGYHDWSVMSQLSEALCRTEGCHPASLLELMSMSSDMNPEQLRWQPKVAVNAV